MTNRTEFLRRSEAMMAFYAEGKYLDALNVTEQLAVDFPDEAATTSFWRVCLLSRAGQIDEALKAMSTAMDQGLWWSEKMLREDEDLAPLQGLPSFEAMAAECRTRHAAAQKEAKPDILIRLPATDGPYPLLIALHARTGSPELESRHWEPILQMGWMLAMPQSSQLGFPNSFVWDDTAQARKEVASHYKHLLEQYPIDPSRLVLAGMSQGAATAIQICLRRLIPARGFLAVVPGGLIMEDFDQLLASKHDLRGYLVVGGRDRRYEMFTQLHALLNQNGISCEMEYHPQMGHEFPKDFEQSINKALKFLLA